MTKRGRLTHLDEQGRAAMVDVGGKPETRREAIAESRVELSDEAFALLVEGRLGKGDAFAVARIAGIAAAKRTSDWIPLAHPVRVDRIAVELEPDAETATVRIVATATTTAKTGVEMEALVAATAAGLALYDMAKAVDRGIVLGPTRLLRKIGGASGEWSLSPDAAPLPRSRRTR